MPGDRDQNSNGERRRVSESPSKLKTASFKCRKSQILTNLRLKLASTAATLALAAQTLSSDCLGKEPGTETILTTSLFTSARLAFNQDPALKRHAPSHASLAFR